MVQGLVNGCEVEYPGPGLKVRFGTFEGSYLGFRTCEAESLALKLYQSVAAQELGIERRQFPVCKTVNHNSNLNPKATLHACISLSAYINPGKLLNQHHQVCVLALPPLGLSFKTFFGFSPPSDSNPQPSRPKSNAPGTKLRERVVFPFKDSNLRFVVED